MTIDEYKAELHELEIKFEIEKRKLAFENNPYKIGDIITDHMGSLKIEKFVLTSSCDLIPTCVYSGIELKKDLTPMKKQTGRKIWACNIIK